jgi:bacillopeptidase F (M6 metalloprotease family)
MSKSSALILLTIIFAPSTVLAKAYELNLSLCDAKTSCSVCMEDIRVKLTVNGENKTVTISGKTTSGEQLKEVLTNCSVQSADDWQCEELRGLIKVVSGELSYTSEKSRLGKDIEACLR